MYQSGTLLEELKYHVTKSHRYPIDSNVSHNDEDYGDDSLGARRCVGGAHDGVHSLLVVMMKKRRLLSIEEPA